MAEIGRGTTPTIVLEIENEDFDMSTIKCCVLAIQNVGKNNTLLFEDPVIDVENKTISKTLTQEETYSLETGVIEVQLPKIELLSGAITYSEIKTATVDRTLGGLIIL